MQIYRIAQNALATFSNKKSNPIDKTIATEADVLVSIFLRTSGQPVNPHNEIYLSVGSIICDICFGKKYKLEFLKFYFVKFQLYWSFTILTILTSA